MHAASARWRRHAGAAALGLWLIACGAADGSTSARADAAPACAPPSASLEGFDFKGGTVFPPRARVSIGNVEVAPGAREVHVPISLDRPTPNTVHLRVLTRNGKWPHKAALEGRDFERVDAALVFRPGDPLTRTLRVPLKAMGEGREFELHFPQGVDGARVGEGTGTVRAVRGAAPTRPREEGFRAPRRFVPDGEPAYALDLARVRWSDRGGPEAFATRLPHGRTQPANAETGLYLDPDRHGVRQGAPRPAIAVEEGALVLRSQQLAAPIRHDGELWRHGAAVLTGERMPATHLTYGQIEWEAQMPDRRGSWPALWLLPTTGWPPEIDVYEGFGESKDWNFARDISANLHGGRGGKRSFTVPLRIDAQRFYGIGGFAEGYHRFAVDIAPDLITWFVDGQEVYQAVNPFQGVTWFPLMTVAVKHQGEYTGGSGTMRVRSLRVWRRPEG